MSEQALAHIQHLSVAIGPRGSATAGERAGHDYVKKTLADLGYQPVEEQYLSATSAYPPFIIALGLTLLAWALFYTRGGVGALAATALGLLVMASVLRELLVKDNPLRWFSAVGNSQNVYAAAPAAGAPRHRVVLAAHVDSHRTPLIWHSRATFRAYRVISTLGTASLLVLVVLFLAGLFAPTSPLPRTISVYPAALAGLAFLMVVQAHFTRYTAGANDNASGVGLLLAFAGRLKEEPLSSTEVILLATGCEEVGACGMADFVRRHASDFPDASYLIVDNVAGAGAGPCYLRSEGLLLPQKHDAGLLGLADRLAQDRPELGAYSTSQQGAYTDAFPPLSAGLPALSFVGYTRDGWIPNWHNKSDTFDNVDGEVLDTTEQFIRELLQRIDAS